MLRRASDTGPAPVALRQTARIRCDEMAEKDAYESPKVNVVAAGRPVAAEVRFDRNSIDLVNRCGNNGRADAGGLRPAVIELPPPSAWEQNRWMDRITPESDSE